MTHDQRVVVSVATDNNYALPTQVTLYSMLKNIADGVMCDIHVLVPESLTAANRQSIGGLAQRFNNCQVSFHNMGDAYSSGSIQKGHYVTTPTFYRLSLPSILANETKCLWIDSDTVVMKDVSALYHTDIGGYYVAGVRTPFFMYSDSRKERGTLRLGLDSLDSYINAGVALLNLENIRADDIDVKFEQLSTVPYRVHDQDVLNVACYGKIKVLPPKFNAMTMYLPVAEEDYSVSTYLQLVYSVEEWRTAATDPVIVHYAAREKPWTNTSITLASLWWDAFSELFVDPEERFEVMRDQLELSLLGTSNNLREVERELRKAQRQLQDIRHSHSYRLGRALLAPLRLAKRLTVR